MKAEKEGKKEDVVYVGIEDPVSVRRGILEASKSLVHVLKSQHGLKAVRAEKHKLIEELRGRVTAISELLAEAKALLPKAETVNLPEEEKPKKLAVVKIAAAPKAPKPAPLQSSHVESHIDRFEKELQDIENKLKTL